MLIHLVKTEIIRLLTGYKVKAITFDNGKEFAKHKRIANALGLQVLLLEVPISQLEKIEQKLSSRPRKKVCI